MRATSISLTIVEIFILYNAFIVSLSGYTTGILDIVKSFCRQLKVILNALHKGLRIKRSTSVVITDKNEI